MNRELLVLVGKYWKDFSTIVSIKNTKFPSLLISIFTRCQNSSQFQDYIKTVEDVPAHLKLALMMSASLITDGKDIDLKDGLRIVDLAKELSGKAELDSQSITESISRAPNLCALLGKDLAAQVLLLIDLETLCKVPPANLPNKVPLLEESDLIRNFSPNEKQAIRQFCSKAILCARLDVQLQRDDKLGRKWRSEIEERLNKFKKAPETKAVRPLAVPLEAKSKKRGGRRQRKMKERLQMSQVEKLQNRVVFGERETTKIVGDEEIGMGLLDRKRVQNVRTVAKPTREPQEDKEASNDNFESDLLQFL